MNDLRDSQATAEHQQEERLIHRVVDRRKQPLHLILRKGFGQGPPSAHHMTRFDGITSDVPVLEEIVEAMFQRMQTPMDGRRC